MYYEWLTTITNIKKNVITKSQNSAVKFYYINITLHPFVAVSKVPKYNHKQIIVVDLFCSLPQTQHFWVRLTPTTNFFSQKQTKFTLQ